MAMKLNGTITSYIEEYGGTQELTRTFKDYPITDLKRILNIIREIEYHCPLYQETVDMLNKTRAIIEEAYYGDIENQYKDGCEIGNGGLIIDITISPF